MQDELTKLREQGIKAEIDEELGRIKILTKREIQQYKEENKNEN